MFDPYDCSVGWLLRFVCENPHVAKDVLAAMDFLSPVEILHMLTEEVASPDVDSSGELTPF